MKYPPGNTNRTKAADVETVLNSKTGQKLYQDPDSKRFVSPPKKADEE